MRHVHVKPGDTAVEIGGERTEVRRADMAHSVGMGEVRLTITQDRETVGFGLRMRRPRKHDLASVYLCLRCGREQG